MRSLKISAQVVLAFGVVIASGGLTLLFGALVLYSKPYASPWDLGVLASLFLLNLVHCVLAFSAAMVTFNPLVVRNLGHRFWPIGSLLVTLSFGVLMVTTTILLMLTVRHSVGELRDLVVTAIWTNLLLSFSTTYFLAILPHWPESNAQQKLRAEHAGYFLHLTTITHIVVIVIFFGLLQSVLTRSMGGPEDDTPQIVTLGIWVEMVAFLIALCVLGMRWVARSTTIVSGIAMAIAFGGAWYYSPVFEQANLYPGSWHPVWMTGIALGFFLSTMIRNHRIRVHGTPSTFFPSKGSIDVPGS